MSEIAELNITKSGSYIEPFAGGAGVAIYLLLNRYCNHIHLNDANYPLFCFWDALVHDTEGLCRKIENCRISVRAWRKHKAILKNTELHAPLDVGFAMFFLNRVNRSGIIKRGGIIGGLEQNGPWKIDARFNKKDLIKRIRLIASHRNKISLYNLDAKQFFEKKLPNITTNSFIYIDPPYYNKGQRLYDNFYNLEDHISISKTIAKIEQKWVVSYDDTPEIVAMYSNFRTEAYSLLYSAAEKTKGKELMVYSKNLVLPSPVNPNLFGLAA